MYKRGLSLIEIILVIAIMAILAVIVIAGLSNFRSHNAVQKDTDIIAAVLREARTQTLASKSASNYGVHVTTSSVTLFTGSTYTEGAASNTTYDLSPSDTTISIALNGGGSDIVFDRLTGETSQHGIITVSSQDTTSSRTITIYKTGLVQVH